ncbi:MAG: hypothetical protein WBD27_14750 [Pyrinomonadaceae bacterium]
MKLRWQFGIIAGIFLAIFTLYPQFKMLYLRGDDWNGHYAYNDIDEVAYASYVRALIDERPRKNDPYTGRDDSPKTPQSESLFSIQFAAPYTIAIPARIFGIGTPWAMTLSGAFAGFLAALAAFWLIGRMTGDSWYAMAASLAVFAGGALAAGEGALPEMLFDGFSYPYFPGFRRYIPAMAMPAIFAMFGFVWKMLADGQEADSKSQIANRKWIYGALATLCYAYTVYSYFYIWTTAAAWMACLAIVWLVERPDGWRKDFKALAGVGAAMALVLVPYAFMLSNRSDTMDHVQLLVHTRMPDLFRFPEYIAFVVLLLLIAGIATKRIAMKDRSTLFALSLALVPFAIFNQQIITGRSLQPIHYQVFIGNYVAMAALMVTIGLLWQKSLAKGMASTRVACALLAYLAIVWGFVECHFTVRVLDEANIERDLSLPVAKKLEELAQTDPDPHRTTILPFDMIQSDDLPSVAPQNVLWARHQHVFAGLSWEESKERYYQFLYYSNIDERGLDHLLKKDFISQIALFGWGRHSDRLSSDSKPLTYGEVSDEVAKYAKYRADFGRSQAANPLLSYVVVNNEANSDLSVLDKWYERQEPANVGKYTIFPVRLRNSK